MPPAYGWHGVATGGSPPATARRSPSPPNAENFEQLFTGRRRNHVTTPKLALTDQAAAKGSADVLVIGTVQGADGLELAPGAGPVAEAYDGDLTKALTALGATGKADEPVRLPATGRLRAGVLLAVGGGKAEAGVSAEAVRRASGAAARAFGSAEHVATTLSAADLSAAVQR